MQFMNGLNMLSDSHLEIPKIPFAKNPFSTPLSQLLSLSLFLFLYSALQIFFSSKNPPNCYPFSSLSPSSSYLPLQPAFFSFLSPSTQLLPSNLTHFSKEKEAISCSLGPPAHRIYTIQFEFVLLKVYFIIVSTRICSLGSLLMLEREMSKMVINFLIYIIK